MTVTLRDVFFRVRHGFRGSPVNVQGHRLRLDESLRRWRTDGEEAVMRTIVDTLGPGDTFVDVGANFGLHTLLGASLVGPSGRVLAIEPVPANIALLRRNIRLNALEARVKLVPMAITDADDQRLVLHGVGSGLCVAATMRSRGTVGGSVTVDTITLDSLLQGIEKDVRLIKIDVEGAEHLVIRGGKRLLRAYRPHLVMEVHEFALPDFATSADAIRSDLEDFGYHERVIDVIEGPEGRYFHSLFTP